MRLTVLGCSGTFPGPTSPCSSYLVEHDGFRLVLDAGNGSLGTLQARAGLLGVDAVLLSHLHGDHCLDLVAYSYARRYHPDGQAAPLPVYGPAGTCERLCGAFEVRPEDGLLGVYDFRDLTPGRLQIGPFEVEVDRVVHPVEAYATRLTVDGRTLVYSGDTAACESMDRLARDADLYLCEASWPDRPDNPPGIHMSGREAGLSASVAGARRLLLTHVVPWTDPARLLEEAAQMYDGPLDLAVQDSTYEV